MMRATEWQGPRPVASSLRRHAARPATRLLCAVALIAMVAPGCGMSQLERHTMAASILHASAGEAAAIIEADAQRAADAAIAPCRDGGAEVSTCEAALAEAMRPRRRAAAVQRTFAAAVDGYVLAVLTVARDEDLGWGLALSALSRVLALWDELVSLAEEFGASLPGLGPVVRGLLAGGGL